jgi:F0F1-type ATP synthase membrane subunit c/vacuolar-type H+-ATPase subunit K
MNFLDTAKESASETLSTVGAFISKDKDPIEQAWITIALMLLIATAMFAAGWAVGFVAGASR